MSIIPQQAISGFQCSEAWVSGVRCQENSILAPLICEIFLSEFNGISFNQHGDIPTAIIAGASQFRVDT